MAATELAPAASTVAACATCHGTRDVPIVDYRGRAARTPCPACAYVHVLEAADVTEAILKSVWSVVEGWYLDGPIEWDDVLSRVERSPEADGRYLDFGRLEDSPALRLIKRTIRQWKREASA